MKKLILLPLAFAAVNSAAFASTPEAEVCPAGQHVISQVGDRVTTCENGKVTNIGKAGQTPIKFAVQLSDGQETVMNVQLGTTEGAPIPLRIGRDIPYAASASVQGGKVKVYGDVFSDGINLTLIPTLMQDGKIQVDFVMSIVEVTSMTVVTREEWKGKVIEQPQLRSIFFKRKLIVENGIPTKFSFGPVVKGQPADEAGHGQYTVMLSASKG